MENKNPKVTLLLPNYNGGYMLNLFFKFLLKYTTYDNYEFIVVDDGSSDNSLEIIKKWVNKFKNCRLIELEHSGIVKALNTGLDNLSKDSKYIARLDGDALISSPGWLERIIEFMEIDEKVGAVVPTVFAGVYNVQAMGVNIFDVGFCPVGKLPLEKVGFRRSEASTYLSVSDDIYKYYAKSISEIDIAPGPCVVYRKIDNLSFDYRFNPIWFEDVDYSLQIRLRGYKNFYFPFVKVHHVYALKRLPLFLLKIINYTGYKIIYSLPYLLKIGKRRHYKKIMQKEENDFKNEVYGRHLKSWVDKYGFNILNPDLIYVTEKYRDTEICWRWNEGIKKTGAEIIRKYNLKFRKDSI